MFGRDLPTTGLSPNVHIHVSVSDLYIPRIGPYISCSRIDRSIVGIYHRHMNVEIGNEAVQILFWDICFKFSLLVLCSVQCGLIPKKTNVACGYCESVWPQTEFAIRKGLSGKRIL